MSIRFLPSVSLPPFNFERTKIHLPTPIPKPSSQFPSLLLTAAGIIGGIATIYFIYIKFLRCNQYDNILDNIDFGFGYVPKPDPLTTLHQQISALLQTSETLETENLNLRQENLELLQISETLEDENLDFQHKNLELLQIFEDMKCLIDQLELQGKTNPQYI